LATRRACRNHQEISCRTIQHHGLVTIEHITIGIGFGRGDEICQVEAALGFGISECPLSTAIDNPGQPGVLLFRRSTQTYGTTGEHHRGNKRLDDQTTTKLLQQQHHVDRRAAKAANTFRERD
jgi:hypothetical protein